MEEWKDIPGYPYYQASSLGRIRRIAGSPRCKESRILSPRVRKIKPGQLAYHDVNLSHACERNFETVHKLVALAFLGERPSQNHEIAHRDGNVGNNVVANLRWATVAENKEDYKNHGRSSRDNKDRQRGADGRWLRMKIAA